MSSKSGKARRGARVLYISYDGLTDPLGRSQILPYLAGLANLGHRITVLSCEKPDRMDRDGSRLRQLCEDIGLIWHPLEYHRYPPILSSAWDTSALQREARKLQRKGGYDITHCRSYIPARAGLTLKQECGVPLLFDMRGFWPDEKVEGKNWSLTNPIYAAVYRYFKALESKLLEGADHIVSLTEAGKTQLLTRPELSGRSASITVIPCCVDFDHFPLATMSSRKSAREELAIAPDVSVLAYLGSLGSWYMLDEMLEFFKVYESKRGPARFIFITLDEPNPIREAAAAHGIESEKIIIQPATRDEVPRLMAAADLGIFFIKPVFSKTASSPTKMGEMLATGLPIVANAGVGDVQQMIDEMGCGVAIRQFEPESYWEALNRLDQLQSIAQNKRDQAKHWFDVELGIERYDRIYRALLD